jgi:hypothetical protein
MLGRQYWFSIEILASLAPAEAELGLRLRLTNMKFNISSDHSNRNVPKLYIIPTAPPTCRESFLSTNLVTNLTSVANTNSVNSLTGYVLTTGIQSGDHISKASDDGNFTEGDSDLLLSKFADIDDILSTLDQLNKSPSSISQLDLTKSAYMVVNDQILPPVPMENLVLLSLSSSAWQSFQSLQMSQYHLAVCTVWWC